MHGCLECVPSDGLPICHMQTLVRLRLSVIGLGERASSPWWPTQISSGSGMSFMQRISPRASLKAAFWAGSTAACRVHDAAIGQGALVHLFRLPYDLEEWLDDSWAELEDSDLASLLQHDEAIAFLAETAEGVSVASKEGPVRIGEPDVLTTPRGHALLAAYYLKAFREQARVLPYASERA